MTHEQLSPFVKRSEISGPHRAPHHSMPTELIQLSPDYLAQLKRAAPAKRLSKLWYVIPAIALAGSIFAFMKRDEIARAIGRAPQAPVVTASATAATATPAPTQVLTTPVITISDGVDPSITNALGTSSPTPPAPPATTTTAAPKPPKRR